MYFLTVLLHRTTSLSLMVLHHKTLPTLRVTKSGSPTKHFGLHIPYETVREASSGDATTAIDEKIINPMALATWVDDKTIDVTIINGREA